MGKRQKILFTTNIPSPYRVDFFNELGKFVDLTVLFETRGSTERDKSWGNFVCESFKAVFLDGFRLGVASVFPRDLRKKLKEIELESFDYVFITNYSTIAGLRILRWCKKAKKAYFIEGDGAYAKASKGFKANLKRKIISGAAHCFATSSSHENYYLSYGAKKCDISEYPFTSVKAEDTLDKPLTCEEKIDKRMRLGLPLDKKIVFSAGQFIDRKNYIVFLKCAKLRPDISFLLIGAGEKEAEYKAFVESEGISNVTILPFIKKPDIYDYFKASDLFLLPTKEDIWGLVVNEALASGLPVITTKTCLAGERMIEQGVNGFLVDSFDDVDGFCSAIDECLINLANLSMSAVKTAKLFTIEEMAKSHYSFCKEYERRKKLFFLGYVTNPAVKLSGMSVAGNNAQIGLVKGMVENGAEVRCVCVNPIAPFPKDKFLSKDNSFDLDGIPCDVPPFCNLPVFKQFSQIRALKKCLAKNYTKYGFKDLIAFNSFPQIGITYSWAKRKLGMNVSTFVAVCPIPQAKYPFPKSLLRKAMDKSTVKSMRKADKLILINEEISNAYRLKAPFIVEQGGVNLNQNKANKHTKSDRNIFVFAGALTKYNGIAKLAECFANRLTDCELHIYGEGDLSDYIRTMAESSENIKFFGFVDHDKAIEAELESDYLILPRDPSDLISKVTFPSKVFEYLSSNRPVLCTKLPCLTGEYKKIISFFDYDTEEGMCETIKSIVDTDYERLCGMTRDGLDYLAKEKQWKNVASRILKFAFDEVNYEEEHVC